MSLSAVGGDEWLGRLTATVFDDSRCLGTDADGEIGFLLQKRGAPITQDVNNMGNLLCTKVSGMSR